MASVRRVLDAAYAAAAGLAAVSLLLIFLVMMAQMGLRQFGVQLPAADDVSAYLCVSTTFFALAATFKRGELIRVGMALDRLGPGARRVAEAAALALAAVSWAALWVANEWFWDAAVGWLGLDLADRAISTPPGEARGLLSEISAADREAYAAGTVDDWSRENWQLSRDIAYSKLPLDRNVCEAKPTGRVALGEPYIADTAGTVRLQVKRAGVRLARLLNEALAGKD